MKGAITMSSKNITEPLQIIYSDGEFKVIKGVVDLGYMGTYKSGNISINFDEDFLEAVFEDDDSEYYQEEYAPLKPYLRQDMTNDEIAKGLTDFYNMRIADINKHQTELNQTFLAYLLDDICGCAFPIWDECKRYIIDNKMPDCDEEDIEEVIYNDETCDMINNLFDNVYEKAHTGEPIEATPAEDIFRKYFPMFDLEKFLSDIEAEYLSLDNANVVFQCSGKDDGLEIACGAYAEITINNAFYDWHNH